MMMKRFFDRMKDIFGKRENTLLAQSGDIKLFIERIISDGILLNEIPSPTDLEEDRGNFIRKRLTDFGNDNFQTDEFGNISVVFPCNRYSEEYYLVYSDIDNLKYSASDSIVEIKDNRLIGIGIGDNGIGAAALLVLCEYIQKNNITLDFNLVILFSLRNSAENNYEGINYFLKKRDKKISGSIYLFGLYLGKLVEKSYGVYNISFFLKSSNIDALGKNYTDSTVDLAAKLYNCINAFDWGIYNSIVNIVRISSGVGFEYFPTEGTVDIEIFSVDNVSLNTVKTKIEEMAAEISISKSLSIENKTISYIPPAIDALNENLNNIARKVHKTLGIETRIANIPDYSYIVNQLGIPAVSLGITTGIKTMNDESVDIRHITSGFKQVLSFLDELNLMNKEADADG